MRLRMHTVWNAGVGRRSMLQCVSCMRIRGSVWYVPYMLFFPRVSEFGLCVEDSG